jgi:elongation factor P
MYSITDLKVGVAIDVDGEVYVVLTSQHSKQARGAGVMKTTLKNLKTGSNVAKTFQGSDRIKPADVAYSSAQYLYSDDEKLYFMDNNNFEQFELDREVVGEAALYLLEGSEVDIQMINGEPFNVKLPPKVNLKVEHTEPGVKGDTASGGSKPAKLETGLTVQVPLFINIDDVVRVNTETGQYTERVKN